MRRSARSDRFRPGVASGLALVALCGLAGAQATLQIIPASPRYQEPVYARIDSFGQCIYGAQVSMNGTVITIKDDYVVDICAYSYDVELGRFPAGTYAVQLLLPTADPLIAQFTVGARMAQTGFPGTVPAVNYSGMWWNASESGWGLSISQGSTNQVFAVWFMYDTAGLPTWYTLELGSWTSTGLQSVYSGSIFRYTGPNFANTFDPNEVVGTMVGTGTLRFDSAGTGRLDYTIAGTSGSKKIARLPVD